MKPYPTRTSKAKSFDCQLQAKKGRVIATGHSGGLPGVNEDIDWDEVEAKRAR